MRDHCVTDLVESWFQILNLPEEDCEASIKCMCFQVIGAYISWIDINLIANDRFIRYEQQDFKCFKTVTHIKCF